MSTAFVERTHLDYRLFHSDDKGYFSFVIDRKFERTCRKTCIHPQTEFVLPFTSRHELKYVINGQHASVFFISYLLLSFHIYIPCFLSELLLSLYNLSKGHKNKSNNLRIKSRQISKLGGSYFARVPYFLSSRQDKTSPSEIYLASFALSRVIAYFSPWSVFKPTYKLFSN